MCRRKNWDIYDSQNSERVKKPIILVSVLFYFIIIIIIIIKFSHFGFILNENNLIFSIKPVWWVVSWCFLTWVWETASLQDSPQYFGWYQQCGSLGGLNRPLISKSFDNSTNCYYYYLLIRVFHISVSRWFFTGAWEIARQSLWVVSVGFSLKSEWQRISSSLQDYSNNALIILWSDFSY